MAAEEHLRAVSYLEIRLLRCTLPADHSLPPPLPSPSISSPTSHLYSLLDGVVAHIESGNYLQAIDSPASQSLFTNLKFGSSESAERFYKVTLPDCVNSFLSSGHGSTEDNIFKAFLVMAIGVAALLASIQCNVIGPSVKLPWIPLMALPTLEDEIGGRDLTEWEAWACKELASIGSQLRGKLSNPEYIIFARILLMRTKDLLFDGTITSFGGIRSISWWASRLIFVHQRLLDGPSSFLFDLLQVFMRESLRHFGSLKKTKDYWGPEMSDEDALTIVSMLHLEVAKMELYYGRVDTSRLHLKSAVVTSKLHSFVSGTLDFRTLHQVQPKAKLHLVAGTSDGDIMMTSPSQKLNNVYDSLLQQCCETTETSDSVMSSGFVGDGKSSESNEKVRMQANATSQLKAIHQAVILAYCLFIARSACDDELQISELEMAPYIEAMDSQHSSSHIIQYVYSLLRIRKESTHSSTKQHALLMMEKLVQGIDDPSPGVAKRIDCYFGVDIPSISESRKELGDLLVSCGLIEEAVKVYEDLEVLSENLIYCYQQLDKKAVAMELINKQLSKTPFNSRLRHLLGVIKGDDSCKVSGSKSALERRYLVRSAHKKRRYIKPNVLWKSVSASSSMNPDGLFAVGTAFLKSRDLDKAVDAFTRAVEIYPKNREAWSNLACLHKQRGDLIPLTDSLRAQLGFFEGSAKWTDLGIFVKFAHVSLKYSKAYMELALRNKSVGELRMAEMHLSFTIENAERFSDTEEFGNLVALYREVDVVLRAISEHRLVRPAPNI